MEYLAFGDESGTTGKDKTYSIGLLCLPKAKLPRFNDYVDQLKKKRGIVGEMKWSKIKNSAGQVNICLDLLNMVLRSSCCFHSIIVDKRAYNNWQTDREKAFYQTYTYLAKNAAKAINSKLDIYIDQKCDKYKRNDEVIGIIANNMLSQLGLAKAINSVSMQNSKFHNGLQVVDILTGAVNSGYMNEIDINLQLSDAKRLVLENMAKMISWDKLCYDTYPNKDFNIWHFPREIRAFPATKIIKPDFSVKPLKSI